MFWLLKKVISFKTNSVFSANSSSEVGILKFSTKNNDKIAYEERFLGRIFTLMPNPRVLFGDCQNIWNHTKLFIVKSKNGEWIQKMTIHMLKIVMHSQRNPIKFQRTPKHSRIWNHSQIWNLVILIKRVFNVVRAQNCQKNEFLVKKSIFSVKNHSFFKKWGFQFATKQMLISCYNIHRLIQPSYTQKREKKIFDFFLFKKSMLFKKSVNIDFLNSQILKNNGQLWNMFNSGFST